MREFESGQVYRVMAQDPQGGFKCLSEPKMSFADRVAISRNHEESASDAPNENLVYVVSQDIFFNDELSTITYFKDITFGVLYEQIRA